MEFSLSKLFQKVNVAVRERDGEEIIIKRGSGDNEEFLANDMIVDPYNELSANAGQLEDALHKYHSRLIEGYDDIQPDIKAIIDLYAMQSSPAFIPEYWLVANMGLGSSDLDYVEDLCVLISRGVPALNNDLSKIGRERIKEAAKDAWELPCVEKIFDKPSRKAIQLGNELSALTHKQS